MVFKNGEGIAQAAPDDSESLSALEPPDALECHAAIGVLFKNNLSQTQQLREFPRRTR